MALFRAHVCQDCNAVWPLSRHIFVGFYCCLALVRPPICGILVLFGPSFGQDCSAVWPSSQPIFTRILVLLGPFQDPFFARLWSCLALFRAHFWQDSGPFTAHVYQDSSAVGPFSGPLLCRILVLFGPFEGPFFPGFRRGLPLSRRVLVGF